MAETVTLDKLTLGIYRFISEAAQSPAVSTLKERALTLYVVPAEGDPLGNLLTEDCPRLTIIVERVEPQGVDLALDELDASARPGGKMPEGQSPGERYEESINKLIVP